MNVLHKYEVEYGGPMIGRKETGEKGGGGYGELYALKYKKNK